MELSIYKIKELLPANIRLALNKLPYETLSKISEIRMRANNISSVTIFGENFYITDTGISKSPLRCLSTSFDELDTFIYKICSGSVYAFENTFKCGYITYKNIRIGLCGKALVKNGEVCGLSSITGVNIRLPNHINGVSKKIIDLVSEKGLKNISGVLIASPPGVGKTTMLRDIAINMSQGINTDSINSKRAYVVNIIDERDEIFIPELFSGCTVDVFSGMSKEKGLEESIRVMSPEVIICDEIGTNKEAEMLLSAHIGGVCIFASVHASDISEIVNNSSLRKLCENGVFSYICLLKRGKSDVITEILNTREVVEKCLK